MTEYIVDVWYTGCYSDVIEADNQNQAMEIARENAIMFADAEEIQDTQVI